MKKFDKIEKMTDNKFLNLYHIFARGKSGKAFDYYFASRNNEKMVKPLGENRNPEGMAIYAILRDQPDKLVMLCQYRYPVGDYLYELPAGLIEPGETAAEAAIREMFEETGLALEVYEGGKGYYRRPYYLAQGMTDESGVIVYGYASGEVCKRAQEDSEDIEVLYIDKEKARILLESGKLSARAALLLIQFIQADPENPFDFLNN